jgi:hypothetical protein
MKQNNITNLLCGIAKEYKIPISYRSIQGKWRKQDYVADPAHGLVE